MDDFETQKRQPPEKEKPAPAQKPEGADKPVNKEKKSPIDRAPEHPLLGKKILLQKPYKIYQKFGEARNKHNGKEEAAVPALYTVLFDGKEVVEIGDANGKHIGFIEKTESGAKQWNTRAALMPVMRVPEGQLFDKDGRKTDISLSPADGPSPVLQYKAGEKYEFTSYLIDAPLSKKEKDKFPLWTHAVLLKKGDKDDRMQSSKTGYIIEKKEYTDMCVTLDFLLKKMEDESDHSKRADMFVKLQASFIAALAGERESAFMRPEVLEKVSDIPVGDYDGDILAMTPEGMASLTEAEISNFIGEIQKVVSEMKKESFKEGNPGVTPCTIYGKKSVWKFIPGTKLP